MNHGFSITELVREHPAFTLGPLTVTFSAGRQYGLLGPNGAGKTTLMDVITLQTRPTSGRIEAAGKIVGWGDLGWKQRIGYVRETPMFYPELTVLETLRFAGRIYPRWHAARARELAARLELSLDQRVATMSKGTRVKLGLVVSLAHGADTLVLDEPTAGVDPTMRDELHAVLADLRAENPMLCVVLSSHLYEDIERADEILILRGGKLSLRTTRKTLERLSLFRAPHDVSLPDLQGEAVHFPLQNQMWVVARRESSLARQLRRTPGCREEPQPRVLAALYRATAHLAPLEHQLL